MKHDLRFHRFFEHFHSGLEPFQAVRGRLPRLQVHSSPRPVHKPVPGPPQVAQCKQRDQLRHVLDQTFVANFGESELAFDYSERMLHFGANTGLELLSLVQQTAPGRILLQCPAIAGMHGYIYMPVHARSLRSFGCPLVARIGKHDRFLAMQQAMPLDHIVDVGRRADDGVQHKTRISVHSDVGLHAKVPLLALLGLMHLRVTLARAVLAGTGCGNQGGIKHSAGLEHQAFGGQGRVDGGQQLDTQVVLFEQVTKSQNRGLVGQAHAARVKPCKLTVQRNVVQGLLHSGVTQAKPLLQEVNAQHRLNRKRRAPTFGACATGCKRLNQTYQPRPRHHQIHLIKKYPFARALGDQFKSGGGKADLFHKRSVAQSELGALGFADLP